MDLGWGESESAGSIDQESQIRELYISALKLADQKQFNELIQFLYLKPVISVSSICHQILKSGEIS